MMFRLAQLKEIQHELRRARAIAESLNLTDIAKDIHASLNQVDTHIHKLEAQTPEPTATIKVATVRRTTKEENT